MRVGFRHTMIALARAALLGSALVLLASLAVVCRARLRGRQTSCRSKGLMATSRPKAATTTRRRPKAAYIVVDKDGRGWGSGGECGCKVKSVKKSGKNEYAVVASCQCIDGPKETWHRKLIVLSDSEIDWDGSKYRKCKPLH